MRERERARARVRETKDRGERERERTHVLFLSLQRLFRLSTHLYNSIHPTLDLTLLLDPPPWRHLLLFSSQTSHLDIFAGLSAFLQEKQDASLPLFFPTVPTIPIPVSVPVPDDDMWPPTGPVDFLHHQ